MTPEALSLIGIVLSGLIVPFLLAFYRDIRNNSRDISDLRERVARIEARDDMMERKESRLKQLPLDEAVNRVLGDQLSNADKHLLPNVHEQQREAIVRQLYQLLRTSAE